MGVLRNGPSRASATKVARWRLNRRIHRWLGLTLVVLLGVQCVTGTILVFEEEIECLLGPAPVCAGAANSAGSPLDALAGSAETAMVELTAAEYRQLDATRLRFDESGSIRVRMREREAPRAEVEAFLSPGGEVLAWRPHKALGMSRSLILPTLRELHTKLLAGDVGKNILGVAAILWLLTGVLGIYLSLPRRFSWRGWRIAWKLPRPGSAFDLHRTGGLWLSGAAFVFALTGVLLVFETSVFGARIVPPSGPAGSMIGFAEAAAAAAPHLPEGGEEYALREIRIDPRQRSYRLDFRHEPEGGLWHRPDERFYLDAGDGALLKREGWIGAPPAERLRHLALPLHSGEVLGLPGRIAAAAAALLLLVQLAAGFALWRRRAAQARRTARRHPAQ